jgi:hypothetical protein
MSESILEQIAIWYAAALAEITIAAGYHQTLQVWRPNEIEFDGTAIKDLTTLCTLGAGDGAVTLDSETLDESAPTTTWWQRFDATVWLLHAASITPAVDTRITRIVADIHARIGVELAAQAATDGPYCGGLADAIELLPWEIGVLVDDNCTLLNVPIRIKYTVLTRDPYSQP